MEIPTECRKRQLGFRDLPPDWGGSGAGPDSGNRGGQCWPCLRGPQPNPWIRRQTGDLVWSTMPNDDLLLDRVLRSSEGSGGRKRLEDPTSRSTLSKPETEALTSKL